MKLENIRAGYGGLSPLLTLPETQGAKKPEGILKRQSNQGDLEAGAPKRCKVRDPHLPCPLPAVLGWRRGRFHIWKVLLCCEAQPRGGRQKLEEEQGR